MQLFLLDVTPLEDPVLFAHCLAMVSPWRKEKVRKLRSQQDRRLSLGAGIMLRHGLAALGCTEEEAGILPDACGKPRCTHKPQLQFNLSRSGTLVLGGFAVGCTVGVDVEKIMDVDFLAVSKQFFHPREHARLLQEDPAERARLFCRIWTCKESCLKAIGCGHAPVFGVDPASFALLPNDDSLLLSGARWYVREYAVAEEYALAVCASAPCFPSVPVVLQAG